MGRLNKQAYPLVTISIDCGGSGTKVVVQIRGGKPKAIWMGAIRCLENHGIQSVNI